MRTKVTLVLLLLNVALFFVIFRVERAWRTESLAREVRHRVLGAEAADIRALAVQSAVPGRSYRLERRDGDWFVTEPWLWRANPNAVSALVRDLQFLTDETSFSVADVERNGQKLADYGLDPPALTVTFASGGSDTTGGAPVRTTLRIGAPTKVGGRVYVLSPDGRRIHVVDASKLESFDLPLDRLRSDTVLTIPFYEARSLNLQTPTGPRILIQRYDSGWTFETPISARASRSAIELTINELDALRATRFEPGAPPLVPAAMERITVEGDGRRETLFLGTTPDASGSVPAQLEDVSLPGGRTVRFTVDVPSDLRPKLADPVDRLRDPHVIGPELDPSAVTSITLSAPGEPPVQLQRLESPTTGAPDAGAWQILLPAPSGQAPGILQADSAAVQRFLAELVNLAAEQASGHYRIFDAPTDADLENWGFNRPERTIVISQNPPTGGAGLPSSLTLQIGQANPRDSDAMVRLASAPSVYAVPADILQDAPIAPRDWRDRQLRLPDSARVASLSLVDLTTGRVRWSWPGQDLSGEQAEAARRLASDLRDLRAQRFIADRFDVTGPPGEPWKYRLDVTLLLPGAGNTEIRSVHPLYIADRTGGSEQIAGAAEFDAMFVPEQRVIDELWTLTYVEPAP